MKRTYRRPAIVLAAALFSLLCFPRLSEAKAAFSAKEGKSCSFCHVGKSSDVKFTKAGEYYSSNHTLAGFAEGASEAKPAAGKTAAPAEAAAPAPAAAKAEAKEPCKGGRENCKSGCPDGKESPCGQKDAGSGKPAMKEGMMKHLDEARKSVAALREHAKKMEGITDPAEFRKAAIEHFRMQDDLQESHVKHIESMMGGGRQGRSHHGGHECQEPCKDCPKK